MSQHWLTHGYLTKNSPILGDISHKPHHTIVKTQEKSSQHVNRLLSEDRVDYVYGENNELLLLVEPGKQAFHFKKRFLILENGDEIDILPSEDIIDKQDYIEYRGSKYMNASVKNKKYIGICDSEAISDQKPDLGKGINYYSFILHDEKKYVISTDVEVQYQDANVRTMSVMELTGIPKDKMNIRFLGQYFPRMDMSSIEFFTYINALFTEAVSYLKVRAPILASHKEFKKISEKGFHSEQDIIDFLALSQSPDRRTSVASCTLMKFVLLLHKFHEHPNSKFLEKCYTDDTFVFSYFKKIFNLPSTTEMSKDKRGVVQFEKTFPEYNNTKVVITARVKSLDSILQKSLADASYFNIDDLKDLLGVTVYIPNEAKKFTYEIMQQCDIHILSGNAYIKNKGLLKTEMLPQDAQVKYKKSVENLQRNTSSSENYDDVKIRGEHPIDFIQDDINYSGNIGAEIKFLYGVPEIDKNEKGMSFFLVYDYFAKHFEGEQNRNPFITAKNLSQLFDNFFPYLVKNISKYPSKDLWKILQEVDTELPKTNEISYFPKNTTSLGELEKFYHSKIKLRLFLYFAQKFEFQRGSFGNEIVFTTKYNREQLSIGGRGHKFKN